MDCNICKAHTIALFTATILGKYAIVYYHCPDCGFVQTEKPYRLPESYKHSINIEDTGLVSRNIHFSRVVSLFLKFFYKKTDTYVDYGGGYGLFCRLMRDAGYNFYRDDMYTENLFARGFAYDKKTPASMVTAFEVFEHLENPLQTIEHILSFTSSILFSTELIPHPIPSPDQWSYYGLTHGQHISLYSYKTLTYIAKKYKLHLYSNGSNLHLLTKKKIRLNKFVFTLLWFGAKIFPIKIYTYSSKTCSDNIYLKSLHK